MLISKFDLYKTEWLDLVFDDRNKNYGAYELRRNYSKRMITAMAVTFLSITALAVMLGIIVKPIIAKLPPAVKIIPVHIVEIIHPPVIIPPKPVTHMRQSVSPAIAAVKPVVFTPLVVDPTRATIEPPKITTTTGSITSFLPAIAPGGTGVDPGKGDVDTHSTTAGPAVIYTASDGIQRMPEPYGGASAWAKFLNKNLKFPEMAADSRMQGHVWISFVVEKDGRLSNIIVSRGAGYGMDEEALRVLKMAPAWKPGIQNGQPVRVKYDLPINFILGDDN